MSNRELKFLLEDMLEAAKSIKQYTFGMDYNSFLNDKKTIDAVVRNFEIIGEASIRINPDFKVKNPELGWERLKGFRNRLVHDYFGIDYEIVWSIIEDDLDNYIEWIEVLITNA